MQALLWPIVSWILREVIVKFIVFTAIFAMVAFLVPKAVDFLTPWLTTGGLSAAFSGLSPSTWFFLDFFQIGFGVPMVIAAYVTRFLIRRLPVIG